LSARSVNTILERIGRLHDAEYSGEARHVSPLRPHDYPDVCVIPTSVCEAVWCRVTGLLMSA
jgi:hypothetical protein